MKAQRKKKSDSFEEVAKRSGADEDEAAFEAKLKKIAKAKATTTTQHSRKP